MSMRPNYSAGLPRFDLLAQINEVEARQEEYTESLAFLGLVNALLEGVGAGGLPAGGTAVAHYTALVLQYIAGNLWQRGYRCEGCAFMHMYEVAV
jgi:nuclear pore complex protein Nup205